LIVLASKADEEHAGEVGMTRETGQGAPEHLEALTVAVHAATAGVGERHDPFDTRELVENARAAEVPGYQPRHGGRAVH
jgi:hypothetical protein